MPVVYLLSVITSVLCLESLRTLFLTPPQRRAHSTDCKGSALYGSCCPWCTAAAGYTALVGIRGLSLYRFVNHFAKQRLRVYTRNLPFLPAFNHYSTTMQPTKISSITAAGIMRGAGDVAVNGPARDCSFPADALLEMLAFLPHKEAQRILATPLSKIYVSSFTFDENIWKARCVGEWKISALTSCQEWRSLHVDLVRCLALVDGTARNLHGDYHNVIAIANVLDTYRTLAEIARACFGRLGLLLEGHEAREATKAIDWRMMDHALWTLKTYPHDVDLQLKVLRFLVLAGRPIGRTEGTVLPTPPTCDSALGAFGPTGEGVKAVLACMERFQSNADVQAMSCWSMVNLALITEQKKSLIIHGGISAIVQAMVHHPRDSEVHFRAMFALINLVTPDMTTEKILQPDTMKAVAAIVVSAIQVFSNMAAIVNRGCLVLYNIALDPGHFNALVSIGAPEELVHAIGNHPSDALLCQCATGTLRRLKVGGVLNGRADILGAAFGVAQPAQAV